MTQTKFNFDFSNIVVPTVDDIVNSVLRSDVVDAGDHLIVRNIKCTDANGNVYEKYDELCMPKDIVRDGTNQKSFNPYNGIKYFEDQGDGSFLPSLPVTLNILIKVLDAAVEKQDDGSYVTLNDGVKKVLDRYHDRCDGYGWHVQNTIIDYGRSEVIHYPIKNDINKSVDLNVDKTRIELSFDKTDLEDCLLSTGLKNPGIKQFVQQFTGLSNPEKLVDLGDYYSWLSGRSKPTKLWFPWSGKDGNNCSRKAAAWVGCVSYDFNLYANYFLVYGGAVCGVHPYQPLG